MKNKDFFYLQYNKIKWKNQEKTKINSFIYKQIIQEIILKHSQKDIAVFDIGFGIGFFIKMLINELGNKFDNILIEGCEPSKINFDYWFKNKPTNLGGNISINTFKETFQNVKTKNKFDFITAIYVFPSFLSDELEAIATKIYFMLKPGGKFILVLADDKYLEGKLTSEKDLSIENGTLSYKGNEYKEILHYSDIPKIGKVVDYNREEKYYLDLFKNNNFTLSHKETLNDNGFICIVFEFLKNS